MSSPSKMRKRRARLARAERRRLADARRAEKAERQYLSLHEAYLRYRNRWYRRLLRWLTRGYFG